ncbi:MAG: hypothetical protein KatS3mg011_2235 [Acidimicrobiia bacterium]|nr:MAG: hypothetical protein KatS3mg011_2235 [Acidimicrobiia bacterium]
MSKVPAPGELGWSASSPSRASQSLRWNDASRQHRRRKGKSDPTDAEAAARAVLAGHATATPKTQNGQVEAIRMLRIARRSAVKSRTQTANQLHAIVVTAPASLRSRLQQLSLGPARRGRRKVPTRRPHHPRGRRQTHTPHPCAALPTARPRNRRSRSTPRRASPTPRPRTPGPQRRRHRSRRHSAHRRGRQPQPAEQRGRLRRPLRRRTTTRLQRQHPATPAQPGRKPTSQQRPLADRARSPPLPPTHQRLHGSPPRRGTHQGRDHPLPQTLRRPRTLQRPSDNSWRHPHPLDRHRSVYGFVNHRHFAQPALLQMPAVATSA